MFTPKNFYEEWDRFISAWYQDIHALDPLMDKNNSLSIDHLPEPFYGDMEDNCSIVIINLNPGTGLCDQCWLRKNVLGLFVNDVLKSGTYSAYAKAFPLIPGPGTIKARGPEPSINWWKSRNAWMERILSHTKSDSSKKPFAIELVPLHSKSFKVANTVEYVKSMPAALNIFDAIGYAIEHSDAKMGLAIGRPIYDVLTNESFKDWAYHDVPMTDKEKTPLDVKRHYQVIENSTKTHRILCTWSEGSNKAPSKDFEPEEGKLIEKYF